MQSWRCKSRASVIVHIKQLWHGCWGQKKLYISETTDLSGFSDTISIVYTFSAVKPSSQICGLGDVENMFRVIGCDNGHWHGWYNEVCMPIPNILHSVFTVIQLFIMSLMVHVDSCF